MIKILVFGMTNNPGGVENVIMNYYRNIDRNKIQFDFLCNTEKIAYYDEIKKLGGNIYKVTSRSKNIIKFYKELNNFFKNHKDEYSAIWVNLCSLANIDYLKYAKKYGIKKRIIHCHVRKRFGSKPKYLLHLMNKRILDKYATDFWSCSEEASNYFYKKSIINSNKVVVINNALDLNIFKFDKKIRDSYRDSLGLNGKFVIGNVGRFHYEKNQLFLIDILNEIKKKEKNAYLVLVGNGPDEEKIIHKAKNLNLFDSIKILHDRYDVNNLMCAFDVYAFPSLFEGFGMTLIEAQAVNLPVIASDNMIDAVNISNIYKTVSLNDKDEWVNSILKYKKYKRTSDNISVENSNFNMAREVKKMENYFYIDDSDKVSAVITTHNRLNYLKKAINSVLNQTYKNIELIVVDDSSTDGTDKYLKSLSNIIYYHISEKEHKNGNYARNIGLKLATGKYIAYLDDDDEWYSDKIAKQVNLIRSNNKLGAVYCGSNILVNDKFIKKGRLNNYLRGNCSKLSLYKIISTTSALLFDREKLNSIGGWDENLNCWQDNELIMSLCQKYEINFVNENLVLYRETIGEKNKISNNIDLFLEAVAYINKKYACEIDNLSLKEKNMRLALIYSNLSYKYDRLNNAKMCRYYLKKTYKCNPNFKTLVKYMLNYTPHKKNKFKLWLKFSK